MKETDKIYPADKGEEELLHNVRHILQEARAKVIHHVNSTLVRAYWQVGKYIVEYEQQGTGRAGYGKAVINTRSHGRCVPPCKRRNAFCSHPHRYR